MDGGSKVGGLFRTGEENEKDSGMKKGRVPRDLGSGTSGMVDHPTVRACINPRLHPPHSKLHQASSEK
jgi:hypothetical protein